MRQGHALGGAQRQGRPGQEHPQVGIQRGGVNHPPRVHHPVRVPGRLEGAERLDHGRGVHPGEQLGAGLAVAVLAGQRTPQRADQVRGVLHERAVAGDAGAGEQVEVDARVHAAVAEVAVVGGLQAVGGQQGVEGAQVLGEAVHGDGGVLPAGPGLAAVRGAGGQARALLTDAPQRPDLRLLRDDDPCPALRARVHQLRGGARLARSGPTDLDEQPRRALGQQPPARGVGAAVAQRGDQGGVHALDGQRRDLAGVLARHQVRGGLGRGVGAVEAQDGQRRAHRDLDQPHGRGEDRGAGALGAHQGAGEVGGVPGVQLVEVVAGHAAGELGEPGGHVAGPAVADGGQPVEQRGAGQGGARSGGEPLAAVGDHVEAAHRVHGLAPRHRVRAARVVADHPADGAAAVRGRVRPEAQPVRGGGALQVVQHHPRLHGGLAANRVDAEHGAQVAAQVHHHRGVHGLPGDGGGGTSGEHRHAPLAAHGQHGGHVVGVRRVHHRQRDVPVVGGVRCVGGQRLGVVGDRAPDGAAEVGGEVGHPVSIPAPADRCASAGVVSVPGAPVHNFHARVTSSRGTPGRSGRRPPRSRPWDRS